MHEGVREEEQQNLVQEENARVETVPGFIKEFSRENSQEERDALAAEIREKRRERDWVRSEQGALHQEEEQLTQELEELAGTIEQYNDASFLGKIKDYFAYKKTKAEIAEKTAALTGVELAIDQKEEEIPQFAEAKKLVDDFYEGERIKWAEAGYTPEDIAKYFNEENLSKLSVEEYAELMKRFPGEMVTHVTRQGIRDHTESNHNHKAGVGEFHLGFEGILEDQRLHSHLSLALKEKTTETAIEKFLELDQAHNREDALVLLKHHFEQVQSGYMHIPDQFADNAAIHFAMEEVVSSAYGGEKGNEIFFAYPAAFVASNMRFSAAGAGLGSITGGAWNDKWVYPEDHQGMDINAGIVFVPADAQVGLGTGSVYEINENMQPIENTSLVNILSTLAEDGEFTDWAESIDAKKLVHSKKPADQQALREMFKQKYSKFSDGEMQAILSPYFIEKVLDTSQLSLKNERPTQERLEDWYERSPAKERGESFVEYEQKSRLSYGEYAADQAMSALRESDMLYKKPNSTISSKEYWDKYFTEHPGQRPSKMVYYKGGDPSRALNEWRRKNGIVKWSRDETFGFSEHHVAKDSPEANQGKDRFVSLALKVIDDRFLEVLTEEDIPNSVEEAQKPPNRILG